jgi:GNAT superfamily N-acetyltransferase
MKTTQRSYADAAGDFNRLSRFMVEHNAYLRSHSTWCLGRFVDWKYGLWGAKPSTPGFWEQNAQLWFDGFGELAGFAISEEGGPDFAILTAAGYRFLYAEILGWVLEHWGERKPAPAIEIKARQTMEAGLLKGSGFQHDSSFATFGFDLTAELAARVPLEAGFVIVDMHAHPDYRAQRILREEAFGGITDQPEEELIRKLNLYGYVRQGPIYHPQTDLCVMAPDGMFVAGCEALIDARNAEADIERVCTHSRFRRRGLARAVIQECLYRLRDMGMQRAYITGYSAGAMALYGSLGHRTRSESWVYKRTAS